MARKKQEYYTNVNGKQPSFSQEDFDRWEQENPTQNASFFDSFVDSAKVIGESLGDIAGDTYDTVKRGFGGGVSSADEVTPEWVEEHRERDRRSIELAKKYKDAPEWVHQGVRSFGTSLAGFVPNAAANAGMIAGALGAVPTGGTSLGLSTAAKAAAAGGTAKMIYSSTKDELIYQIYDALEKALKRAPTREELQNVLDNKSKEIETYSLSEAGTEAAGDALLGKWFPIGKGLGGLKGFAANLVKANLEEQISEGVNSIIQDKASYDIGLTDELPKWYESVANQAKTTAFVTTALAGGRGIGGLALDRYFKGQNQQIDENDLLGTGQEDQTQQQAPPQQEQPQELRNIPNGQFDNFSQGWGGEPNGPSQLAGATIEGTGVNTNDWLSALQQARENPVQPEQDPNLSWVDYLNQNAPNIQQAQQEAQGSPQRFDGFGWDGSQEPNALDTEVADVNVQDWLNAIDSSPLALGLRAVTSGGRNGQRVPVQYGALSEDEAKLQQWQMQQDNAAQQRQPDPARVEERNQQLFRERFPSEPTVDPYGEATTQQPIVQEAEPEAAPVTQQGVAEPKTAPFGAISEEEMRAEELLRTRERNALSFAEEQGRNEASGGIEANLKDVLKKLGFKRNSAMGKRIAEAYASGRRRGAKERGVSSIQENIEGKNQPVALQEGRGAAIEEKTPEDTDAYRKGVLNLAEREGMEDAVNGKDVYANEFWDYAKDRFGIDGSSDFGKSIFDAYMAGRRRGHLQLDQRRKENEDKTVASAQEEGKRSALNEESADFKSFFEKNGNGVKRNSPLGKRMADAYSAGRKEGKEELKRQKAEQKNREKQEKEKGKENVATDTNDRQRTETETAGVQLRPERTGAVDGSQQDGGLGEGRQNNAGQSGEAGKGKTAKLKASPNNELTVQYEVVELNDLVPSHDPNNNFAPNPNYQYQNERLYNRERGSKDDVLNGSVELDPDMMLDQTITPTTGAPIVDSNNNVLGGNGRSMMLIRALRGGKFGKYAQALRERAGEFGLSDSAFEGIQNPVLVRRLQGNQTQEERQALISELNNVQTKDTTKNTKAVSRAGKLSDRTKAEVLNLLNEGNTLRGAFDLPASRDVVQHLIDDGVIQASEQNRYVNRDGMLNPDGKNHVIRTLTGSLVDSYETLESLPTPIQNKIDAVIGQVLATEPLGGKWNIRKEFSDAISLISGYLKSNSKFGEYLNQVGLDGKANVDSFSKESIVLADNLLNRKQNDLLHSFREYANEARRNANNRQGGLLQGKKQEDVFNDAFNKKEEESTAPENSPEARASFAETPVGERNNGVSNHITRVVNRLSRAFKNAANTSVVRSFDELPSRIREEFKGRENELEGVYDPKTDTVYIVADNIADDARAVRVWAHEQVVHHGLRNLFPEGKLKQVFNNLWQATGGMRNPDVKRIADKYGLDPRNSESDRQTLMEEYLADLAEKRLGGKIDSPAKRVWNRLVQSVRNFLNSMSRAVTGRDLFKQDYVEKLLSDLQDNVMSGRKHTYFNDGKPIASKMSSVDVVRKTYEGTDAWMKAPNGQPTNLTEEQWLQARTPEFKEQFGDWEQAFINDFVEKSLADRTWQKTITIPVSLEKQREITEVTGKKFGKFILTSSELVHAINKHGNQEREANRKPPQIAIDKDTVKLIPWLINNFDTIDTHREGKTSSSFLLKKRIDGHIVLCEYYQSEKSVRPKTMWIEKVTPIPDTTQGDPAQNGQSRGRVYDSIVKKIVQSSVNNAIDKNGEPLASEIEAFNNGEKSTDKLFASFRDGKIMDSTIQDVGNAVRSGFMDRIRNLGFHVKGDMDTGPFIPQEKDLSLFERVLNLPHWIAKEWPRFGKIYNRQLDRLTERQKATVESTKKAQSFFDMKAGSKELEETSQLIWKFDGQEVEGVTAEKFLTEKLPNGKSRLSINPKWEEQFNAIIDKENVSDKAKQAYKEVRKVLDDCFITAHNDLAKMGDVSESHLKKLRQNIGHVQGYFPHVRHGDYYIAFYRKGENGNEAAYRRHFDAPTLEVAKQTAARLEKEIRGEKGFKADEYVVRAGTLTPNAAYDGTVTVTEKETGNVVATRRFRADSEGAAKKKEQEIREELEKEYNGDGYDVKAKTVSKLPEALFEHPFENVAIEQVIKSATSRIQNESQRQEVERALTEGVADTLKARGFGSHMIERSGVEGFETENVQSILYEYITGMYGWKTKMQAARDFAESLGEIDAVKQPNLWKYSKNYAEDMLRNTDKIDKIAGNIKAATFVWLLGANIKTATVNLTQNIVTGVPELERHLANGFLGKDRFAAPYKTLVDMVTGKKGKGLGADQHKLIQELFDDGTCNSQYLEEMQGKLDGGNSMFRKVADWLGAPMAYAERFNRASLALAAYNAAVDGKLSKEAQAKFGIEGKATYEQAKAFAKTVVSDSHFELGKKNAPEMLRHSDAGRLASVVYSMRSFTGNYLNMLRYNWGQGKEGKKMIAKSLLGNVALGGVVAFPFYSAISSVLQMALFGSDDDDTMLEKLRRQLPENDLVRDLVCYGAPTMLGVNIGGSMKIETPLDTPLRESDKLSDIGKSLMVELIGAPLAILSAANKSYEAVKVDNYYRATEEIVPTFAKNALAAYRLYTEGNKSIKGKPIGGEGEDGAKISGSEALGKVLGFQPVSKTRDYDEHLADERVKSVLSNYKDKYRLAWLKGYDEKDSAVMRDVRMKVGEHNRRMKAEGRPYLVIDFQKDIVRQAKQRRRNTKPNKAALAKRKMNG